jgi:hypothetical protein
MVRESSTSRRRLKNCRIMYRPWAVPTLISYPPPPPAPPAERVVVARPSTPPPEYPQPLPVRSRSERRRRDCVFIPDMDVALEFIEARRYAAEVGRRRPAASRGIELDGPVAIGLLMTVAPPLAVTLVWSSPRFARPAQIALTIYGAVVTAVLAAIVLSLL